MKIRSLFCFIKRKFEINTKIIVGYPPLHYSAMLRYVWSLTEERTVVADDGWKYAIK